MSIKNTTFIIIRIALLQPLWEKLPYVSHIEKDDLSSGVCETVELHAKNSARLRLANKSPMVVLDVGTNTWHFPLAAVVQLRPARIDSCKPFYAAIHRLSAKAQRAPSLGIIESYFHAQSFFFGDAALHAARQDGTTVLIHDPRHPTAESSPKFDDATYPRSLDEFRTENGVEEIEDLRIDVKGYRTNVFRAAHRMSAEKSICSMQFVFGKGNICSRTFARDFFYALRSGFDFHRIVLNGLRKLSEHHPRLEANANANYLVTRKR